MKPTQSTQAKLSRRNFLIAVSAGGAATAAAVASKVVPVPQPAVKGADKRGGKGYEETAHVRNYYRTTQV
jgi:opacity protein-like surface antigen